MLDVFGLALLVFLTEGDSLVRTDVKPGLYLMVAAIIILTAIFWIVTTANRRMCHASPADGGTPGLDGPGSNL